MCVWHLSVVQVTSSLVPAFGRPFENSGWFKLLCHASSLRGCSSCLRPITSLRSPYRVLCVLPFLSSDFANLTLPTPGYVFADCQAVQGWEADSHTSANFQGCVAVLAPTQSWCARWQRLESFKPGVYALCVYGTINQEAREELGDNYRSRDTSKDLGT